MNRKKKTLYALKDQTAGQQTIHFFIFIFSFSSFPYSVLNEFAGLAKAALMALKLTVINAIKRAVIAATAKIHHEILMR